MDIEGKLTDIAIKNGWFDPTGYDGKWYSENKNNDALSDDWLENDTSYIYNVGVLVIHDNNKMDYCRVLLGIQRNPHDFSYLGNLNFPDGENMDIGRVIKRAISLLVNIHSVFEVN